MEHAFCKSAAWTVFSNILGSLWAIKMQNIFGSKMSLYHYTLYFTPSVFFFSPNLQTNKR